MQALGWVWSREPTVILFNNTAVAFDPAAGPDEVRRTLLTDENVEEVGIRFDCLTLPANASFRFEPSARSMVWFQVPEGNAKLETKYTDGLSDRHSVFLPPAFDATLSTERGCAPNYRMPDALIRSSRPSSRFSRYRIGRGNQFCSARTMDASGFSS